MASPVPVHGVVQGVVCVVVFEQFLDLAPSAWIGTISSPPESSQQGMMTATEQRVHQGTSQLSYQWQPGLYRDPVRDATPLRVRLDDTLVLPDALYPGGGPLQEPAPGLDLYQDEPMPVEWDHSQQALDSGCAGGTDFDAPVLKAVEIIRKSKTMKQADVVLITDGEDDLEPETVEAATALTRSEGVSWFAIGVGREAQTYLRSLEPIATNMVAVRDTTDSDPIVPVINLDSEVAA
jgi:hypothetical protein